MGVTGGGLPVVTHKTELEVIDGTPEKRSFLSLISDYNLKIGIFELVDNAIDFWTRGGATSKLHIDIRLDADRQVLSVRDDAGGVQRKDIAAANGDNRVQINPAWDRLRILAIQFCKNGALNYVPNVF